MFKIFYYTYIFSFIYWTGLHCSHKTAFDAVLYTKLLQNLTVYKVFRINLIKLILSYTKVSNLLLLYFILYYTV